MVNVFDVANYFLAIVQDKDYMGEMISNLKLQKLLYYAQGLHLAMYNKPLFEDEIEAWQYGPVVPVVYRKYKKNGALYPDKKFNTNALPNEVKDFIEAVYRAYGQFSAWKLVDMTHNEDPWRTVFNNQEKHIIISKNSMAAFFKTRIE